ncbi:hypothetical protein PAMA_002777 [Pampus argenteus]
MQQESIGELTDTSDSEIVIKTTSREFDQADTLIIHLDEDDAYAGTSGCLDVKSSCYRNYTNLFSPIVIDDEDDEDEVVIPEEINNPQKNLNPQVCRHQKSLQIWHLQLTTRKSAGLTYQDLIVRGFRRSSYSDNSDIFVKFADDAGSFEDGLDTGSDEPPEKSPHLRWTSRKALCTIPQTTHKMAAGTDAKSDVSEVSINIFKNHFRLFNATSRKHRHYWSNMDLYNTEKHASPSFKGMKRYVNGYRVIMTMHSIFECLHNKHCNQTVLHRQETLTLLLEAHTSLDNDGPLSTMFNMPSGSARFVEKWRSTTSVNLCLNVDNAVLKSHILMLCKSKHCLISRPLNLLLSVMLKSCCPTALFYAISQFITEPSVLR